MTEETDLHPDASPNETPPARDADLEQQPANVPEEAASGTEPRDTVKEYFRAIGLHPLLSATQEIELGLAVERWIRLKELTDSFTEEHRQAPRPAELAVIIYDQIASLKGILDALASALEEEPPDSSLSTALSSPPLRECLQGPLPPEITQAIAEMTHMTEEEVPKQVDALAKLSRLLPMDVVRHLDSESLRPDDPGTGQEAVTAEILHHHEAEITGYWDRLSSDGWSASERLTNSNLRLVVSVARRYLNRGLPLLKGPAAAKYIPRKGLENVLD